MGVLEERDGAVVDASCHSLLAQLPYIKCTLLVLAATPLHVVEYLVPHGVYAVINFVLPQQSH